MPMPMMNRGLAGLAMRRKPGYPPKPVDPTQSIKPGVTVRPQPPIKPVGTPPVMTRRNPRGTVKNPY